MIVMTDSLTMEAHIATVVKMLSDAKKDRAQQGEDIAEMRKSLAAHMVEEEGELKSMRAELNARCDLRHCNDDPTRTRFWRTVILIQCAAVLGLTIYISVADLATHAALKDISAGMTHVKDFWGIVK
jgi:hypothetical protein